MSAHKDDKNKAGEFTYPQDIDSMQPETMRKFLHDMSVHQIELETQIRELCNARTELDGMRARYFELYDIAPVGYCTLSENGNILEANLTAADLLGASRAKLFNSLITNFIYPPDQDILYLHRKRLFETGEPQSSKLRINCRSKTFWALIKSTLARGEDDSKVCRMIISDISDLKQSENELRIKEMAIESALNAIAIADLNGIINYVNPAFIKMWKYGSAEEIVGKSVLDFWLDIKKAADITEKIRTHGGYCGELTALRRGGGQFEAQVVANVVTDKAGVPICMLGSFSDITEQKKAEGAIKRSEQKLKNILASLNDSIIIADLDGNIIETNEYTCRKLKYEKDELLKLTIKDINAPFNAREIELRIKKVEKDGKAIFESHYITKDGVIFPVEISASMTRFLQKPALIALVRDISDRVKIENDLLISEKRFHELIERSSEGFWVIDNGGDTVYLNRQMADMLGYTVAEVGSRNIGEFIYGEHMSAVHELYSKLTRGSAKRFEAQFIHKSGKKVYALISASILTDRDGKTTERLALVTDITEKVELVKKIELVNKEAEKNYTLGDIVGKSEYMRSIFETLPYVSESGSNVLLEGPSGTGKSLIARTIHNLSSRRDGPFIVINCGALPETLLESELFGYVKGAFTDAKTDKPGKFMAASKGTIFLDEIGEMPVHLQVKLLRVIDEKCLEPLGSTKTVKVNFRLIAATNKNLKTLVSEGKFREDLYYRLRVVYFNIPPLRERREDLDLLAYSFINKLNISENKNINSFSDEVRAVLRTYDFPGNARELNNMLEYAYILCRENKIKLSDLPEEYIAFYNKLTEDTAGPEAPRSGSSKDRAALAEFAAPDKITGSITDENEAIIATETLCKQSPQDNETFCKQSEQDNETFCKHDKITKQALLELLIRYKYNKSRTSKALNISRVTLWRLIKKFHIDE